MNIFLILCVIILTSFEEIRCSNRNITLSYGGKNYDFNVTPLQRKTFDSVSVWTVDSNSEYNNEGVVNTNGVLFEDTSKKAILFEKTNCSEHCWEGVFGLGTKRNVIKTYKNESSSTGGIYKKHPVGRKGRSGKNLLLNKNKADKAFVKVVIVIDNALFKKLGEDVENTVKYLSIYWSAVDLQYRNITTSDVEVRVTGVIIEKTNNSLNYISENSPDGSTVNVDKVLFGARSSNLIMPTNITNYDAIVTMSGLQGFITVDDKYEMPSSGVSFNASVCDDEYHYSVITDDGQYFGIHNAIHELGHLLGLDHDAVEGNAMFCFPKNRRELPVMWPRYEDRELEYWSKCSLESLKIFLDNDEQSWCLKSEIHHR